MSKKERTFHLIIKAGGILEFLKIAKLLSESKADDELQLNYLEKRRQ